MAKKEKIEAATEVMENFSHDLEITHEQLIDLGDPEALAHEQTETDLLPSAGEEAAFTPEQLNRMKLKAMVKGAYKLQRLRIQISLCVVDNFKKQLGLAPSAKEADADPRAKQILEDIRTSYKKITEAVKRFPTIKTFRPVGIINDYAELMLIKLLMDLEESEKWHFAHLAKLIQEYPIWTEFLNNVKGVGPAMAGVIISGFDIHKAKYPSSLWAYCGLGVINGEGQSRKARHLRDKEYIAKDGTVKTRKDLGYNPWLKSKLLCVLGGAFLKQKERSSYSKIYYDTKHREESKNSLKPKSEQIPKGQIHLRSLRKMVKIFLIDLYVAWRKLEGLPAALPYHEAKLGLVHNSGR